MLALVGQKSPYFTFRYDYQDEKFLEPLETFLKVNLRKYAIFKEVADETGKLHVQGVAIPFKSASQFRRDLQSRFPNVFCKSNYSFAPVNKDESYPLYICKQGNVWINNMWTEEEILSNKTKYWKNNKNLLPKAKSNKVITWSQQLTIDIAKKHPDVQWSYDVYSIQILIDETLTAMGKTSKKLSGRIVKELVLGQLNALNPTISSGLRQKLINEEFNDLHWY